MGGHWGNPVMEGKQRPSPNHTSSTFRTHWAREGAQVSWLSLGERSDQKTSSFLCFDLVWRYCKIFVLAFWSVLNILLPPFSTQFLCCSDVFFHSDYWLDLNNPFKPTLVFRSSVLVGRDSEFFSFSQFWNCHMLNLGFKEAGPYQIQVQSVTHWIIHQDIF